MEVKGIFKTLIGTMVIIVMTSVIIEMFNLNTSSYMVNQYVRLAAEQTCSLFTQETYKSPDGISGSINGNNIYAADGTEYNKYTDAGGSSDFSTFYALATNTSSDPDLIWGSLYTGNYYFRNELAKIKNAVNNDTSIRSLDPSDRLSGLDPIDTMYPELASLDYVAAMDAANTPFTSYSGLSLTLDQFWLLDEYDSRIVNYNNWLRAKTYFEKNYTPVNIGIPYLDSTVVNKMFKWQSTKLLSNCSSALIQKNEHTTSTNGVYDEYVNFKGFAVYTRGAKLGNYNESTGSWEEGFTYHACDLNTLQGRLDLKRYTGMSAVPSETGDATSAGLSYKQIAEDDITAKTKISNNVVIVVEVDYAVPVGYVGVTPLKEAFNWVMGTDSSGAKHSGVQGYKPGYNGPIDGTIMYQDDDFDWVRGTIYYTLVR